jgi:inorganic pyrophosphatase
MAELFNPFARPELAQAPREAEAESALDVRVTRAGGETYRLDWDKKAGAIRVSEVLRPRRGSAVDHGLAEGALGPDGRPLPVLLLRDLALPEGVLVGTRPIAAARHGPSAWLVTVPLADERLGHIRALDDLDPDRRAALEAALRQEVAGEGLDPADLRLEPATEAVALAREARRRGRRARGEQARQREGLVAWRPSTRAQQRWVLTEVEQYTAAEYGLLLLPYRFQKYAREVLLPDERVLVVIHRPPSAFGRRWLLGGRTHDAVFVLTDQQVLLLEDAFPPGSTLVDWGYRATSTSVERVIAADVRRLEDRLRLELTLEASGGQERLAIAFPLAAGVDCIAAVEQLDRFRPPPDTRALRRQFRPEPTEASLPRLDAFLPPERVERLLEDALAQLPPGAAVLERAVTPPIEDQRSPRVLLLTERGVYLFEVERLLGQADLAAISTLRLENALPGSRLDLMMPGPAGLHQLSTRFPYQVAEAFVELYHAARRLLGGPVTVPEPGTNGRGPAG